MVVFSSVFSKCTQLWQPTSDYFTGFLCWSFSPAHEIICAKTQLIHVKIIKGVGFLVASCEHPEITKICASEPNKWAAQCRTRWGWEMRSTRAGRTERSISPMFPMILRLSGERQPLLCRCVGLLTVIITDGSHNRSGRWDNIVSTGAAGERLDGARLGVWVPGCSIAWGPWGFGPTICRGEFLSLRSLSSGAAQTVAGRRCWEFLLLLLIDRNAALCSYFVTLQT